jgi:hypothetical protein
VALRQGCIRESCGEEGEEVVERLWRDGGEGEEESWGLERRRWGWGEVCQKGGEVVLSSGLEGLIDLGRGVVWDVESEVEEDWSEEPGS